MRREVRSEGSKGCKGKERWVGRRGRVRGLRRWKVSR
jgi:hypothetical protein